MLESVSIILSELKHFAEQVFGDDFFRIAVFGSYAHEFGDDEGEMDVLVVLENLAEEAELECQEKILMDQWQVQQKYGVKLALRFVSRERYEAADGFFLETIMNDLVELK